MSKKNQENLIKFACEKPSPIIEENITEAVSHEKLMKTVIAAIGKRYSFLCDQGSNNNYYICN